MDVSQIQIISTFGLLAIMILVIVIIKRYIRRFSFVRAIEINRRKVIFNISYFIVYLISGFILAIIWGIEFREFTIFISSVLAVLGVGFFAQWSLLSSLTASFILFFYHPVRIGHRIRIIDKDYEWVGIVKNITAFYFFMETDAGEKISLPNSLVMQKGIEILELEKEELSTEEDELTN